MRIAAKWVVDSFWFSILLFEEGFALSTDSLNMYVSVVANVIIYLLQIENMLKIAILVRQETTDKCTGKGCLRAFFSKKEGFARYHDTEIELVGFFNSGGDLDYKLKKMKEAGVQVIHVSTCMRGKYEGYEELVKKIGKDFDVIGYTHGSQDGKTRKTETVTGKFL